MTQCYGEKYDLTQMSFQLLLDDGFTEPELNHFNSLTQLRMHLVPSLFRKELILNSRLIRTKLAPKFHISSSTVTIPHARFG